MVLALIVSTGLTFTFAINYFIIHSRDFETIVYRCTIRGYMEDDTRRVYCHVEDINGVTPYPNNAPPIRPDPVR